MTGVFQTCKNAPECRSVHCGKTSLQILVLVGCHRSLPCSLSLLACCPPTPQPLCLPKGIPSISASSKEWTLLLRECDIVTCHGCQLCSICWHTRWSWWQYRLCNSIKSCSSFETILGGREHTSFLINTHLQNMGISHAFMHVHAHEHAHTHTRKTHCIHFN
jgi:hypothetical protein